MKIHLSINKRAFTLIELVICIALVGIIAAIAIPFLMENQIAPKIGATMLSKASKARVVIIAVDRHTQPTTYICRIDNGADAPVRFVEARFTRDELEILPEAEPRVER